MMAMKVIVPMRSSHTKPLKYIKSNIKKNNYQSLGGQQLRIKDIP